MNGLRDDNILKLRHLVDGLLVLRRESCVSKQLVELLHVVSVPGQVGVVGVSTVHLTEQRRHVAEFFLLPPSSCLPVVYVQLDYTFSGVCGLLLHTDVGCDVFTGDVICCCCLTARDV